MKRSSLTLGTFAIALAMSGPASADYSVVRWTSGDCKIWQDNGPSTTPWGSGWAILAFNIPYYETARSILEDFYRQGVCR